MSGSRPVPSLTEVFGPSAGAVLERWSTLNDADIRIDRELLGHSTSRVALCYVRVPEQGLRKMAVKTVRSTSDRDSEAARHRRARQASPGFAADHLVRLEALTLPVADGSHVLFQEFAGGSSDECGPMSVMLGRRTLAPAARLVLGSLLCDWNPEPTMTRLDPAGLVRSHLGSRIDPGGSVFTWAAPMDVLLRRPRPWLRFPDGAVLPNPFAFALAPHLFEMPDLWVIVGNFHGDLHLDNVIVRLGHVTTDYWLIDLASYRPDAPLSWDHASLLMAILARSFQRMRPPQRDVVANYLVEPSNPTINQVRNRMRESLSTMQATGREWAEPRGLLDDWARQYRLSLVSSALIYTGRSSIPDGARWWFFQLAARILDRHLRGHRIYDNPDVASAVPVQDPRRCGGEVVASPARRDPPALGATPPFLSRPRRNAWQSKTQFQKTTARLRGETDEELAHAAHAYLYGAFGGLRRPVRIRHEQVPGLMIVEVYLESGPIRVAVQARHVPAGPEGPTAEAGGHCAAAVDRFMAAGSTADAYLLLHDQDHRSRGFDKSVLDSLGRLESTGVCGWAGLWGRRDLALHMWDAIADHVIDTAERLSREALDHLEELAESSVVQAVPTSTYEVMMGPRGMQRVTEERYRLADPAQLLVGHGQGLELVLGEFGFGKSTAAIRAARSSARRTLLLPGARLPVESKSSQLMLSALVESGIDWASLPEEVHTLVRPIIGPCVEWHLGQASDNLCLIVDGLDEAPLAHRRNGVANFFQALRWVRVPVVVSARTEFWRSKQAELVLALPLAQEGSAGRRTRVIDLLPWDRDCMMQLIDSTAVDDPARRRHLTELRGLVHSGEYQTFYGDVPRRPLFLRMLIDDVVEHGVRPRDRLDLLEGWVEAKIVRDWSNPLRIGNVTRPPIAGSEDEDLDTTIGLAFSLMSSAARLMTTRSPDGDLVLLPSTTLDRLRARVSNVASEIRPAPLFVQSVLMPSERAHLGTPTEVRFAHRAFQEYFLARSLWLDPDPRMEAELDDDVRGWIDGMRSRCGPDGPADVHSR